MVEQNINNIFPPNDDLPLDLDIKIEIRFSRKDHPEGKMIPVSVDGKEEFILIPLDIKDGDTIKISGRGKYNARLGKTGDLNVLVRIEENTIPWTKMRIPGLIVVLLVAICGLIVFISQQSDSTRNPDVDSTLEGTYEYVETRSVMDLAYEKAETHCKALSENGDYDEAIRYLIECQAKNKDDDRYAQLLVEYQEMQKNAVLNKAAEYAQDNEYRMAIQTLDNAWNTYGNSEYFAMAAQYRQNFGIYNTARIAAGKYNTMLIRSDSSVDIVGDSSNGELEASDWTNIIAVSAGDRHVVGLKADGTVVAEGENIYKQCEVETWNNVVAISAGDVHTVALLQDGSLLATGYDVKKQCRVEKLMSAAGEKRIVAISAGYLHTLALLEDGTVIACGDTSRGACDVLDWTDIVAIYTGTMYSAGLKSDGTVVITGEGKDGKSVSAWNTSEWTDIVNMSAGDYYLIALKSDGTVLSAGLGSGNLEETHKELTHWKDIIQIAAGNNHTVGLTSEGRLLCAGSDNYDQCDFEGTFVDVN